MVTQEDELKKTETLTLEERRAFMNLPMNERRRMLAHQAEEMAKLYQTEPELTEREQWQGGDIVEY